MILEGIVTTLNEDGSLNIAPMGPVVDSEIEFFELKPFRTSTTYRNLRRTECGVLHITDDVLVFAQAAIGNPSEELPTLPTERIKGRFLAGACRVFEFRVDWMDDTSNRSVVKCKTVFTRRLRDFFGFNRAKHAVIEAAILSTRVDFLPPAEVRDQFARLGVIVEKTGGENERTAFELLDAYVKSWAEGATLQS